MTNINAFEAAVHSDNSYMSSLTRSMGLVLEEFYAHLRCVGVSAVTGQGMKELFEAVQKCGKEYET
jgi:hypothetical protein